MLQVTDSAAPVGAFVVMSGLQAGHFAALLRHVIRPFGQYFVCVKDCPTMLARFLSPEHFRVVPPEEATNEQH